MIELAHSHLSLNRSFATGQSITHGVIPYLLVEHDSALASMLFTCPHRCGIIFHKWFLNAFSSDCDGASAEQNGVTATLTGESP
jgi:hypothetical protein